MDRGSAEIGMQQHTGGIDDALRTSMSKLLCRSSGQFGDVDILAGADGGAGVVDAGACHFHREPARQNPAQLTGQ